MLWLNKYFSAAFPEKPVPLKIGIHHDIFKLNLPDSPSKVTIRRALGFYTNSALYLREMMAGTPRVDLDGKAAGEVGDKEALIAKQTMSQYRKTQASRDNTPKPTTAKKATQPTPPPSNPKIPAIDLRLGQNITIKNAHKLAQDDLL